MKQAASNDSVALLDRDMAEKNLSGYWRLGMEGLPSYPITSVEPCLWKWMDVHGSLVRAGEVISLENSERRVVRLVNPGLDRQRAFATHTLQISFQYVKPGENARAHRHTPAALRFVVQGNGAYTTVNGQQCVMEPGDLILTPKLTWHDHSNDSAEPMIWLDGLDFPLVGALHQVMQERYPERRQPIEKSSEEVIGQLGSSIRHGLPLADFFHYKWRDTEQSLRALAASEAAKDRFDGYLLEYRNPLTGGATMTSIQCTVQLLPAKVETESHRHTSTAIYHVFCGKGATQIGDKTFEWEQGDSFVVPLWHPHRHINRSPSDDAILFSMSDAPVLKALDLYREES
ncbi:MAG TPA: cupin domain-containing protein [Terriglobales bacterium]|jgi:gentisate 1,2-dioxygenase|nr:cupin domain-containing protein [Terriglobales bacterium]